MKIVQLIFAQQPPLNNVSISIPCRIFRNISYFCVFFFRREGSEKKKKKSHKSVLLQGIRIHIKQRESANENLQSTGNAQRIRREIEQRHKIKIKKHLHDRKKNTFFLLLYGLHESLIRFRK